MSTNTDTPEYRELAALSQMMQRDFEYDNRHWNGSPFEWIIFRPGRLEAVIGKRLVSAWFVMHNFNVSRSPDSEADRVVEDKRVEIKFSTQRKNGNYLFEQIRDQNYDFAVFLGLSPHDAHCWVVPKADLMRLWKEEHKLSSQHGGQGGSDTAWAWLSADKASAASDAALSQYGNGLREALDAISALTGFAHSGLSEI